MRETKDPQGLNDTQDCSALSTARIQLVVQRGHKDSEIRISMLFSR